MSFFLFQNADYMQRLAIMQQMSLEASEDLFKRLGIKRKKERKIVLLAIASKNTVDGCIAAVSLVEECKRIYRRDIDLSMIKIVSLSSLEAASKSPYLEQASFIFFPDEDLPDAQNYEELEKILPFVN